MSSPSPFDAFPPSVRDDIDGLIWLGYLEEEIGFCGHTFILRTLRGDEELLVGLLTKDYVDTTALARANVWATIGLALTSIDGHEDFCPPASPDGRAYARARMKYLSEQWYWPTAIFLYGRYSELLARQAEALDALEDFCSRSLPTPTPFASSSTVKASSAPLEDIREYLEPQEGSTESRPGS